jgi:superfamily II DNA or RNA helicase
MVITKHLRHYGANFVNPNARNAVAGVDTLIRRQSQYARFLQQVNLWVTDEGHHLQKDNKWGDACAMMPNARGLAVTATPIRADGRGLSRATDGILDTIVEGPTMRELINAGWLTDYRIFWPGSDVDYSKVEIGSTGDYKAPQLKSAVRESHLVGDVVEHYLRIAPGKLGVTFATDVETATDIARQFNQRMVPAEVVSAKTPDKDRDAIIERFRQRHILQLVNVDLFGEGFDLPAIEVVSMARRTMSFSLYCQQFGRALRIMPGKVHAIIIDHAGNVALHGLPDKARVWNLDSREKKPACKNPDDDIPLRYCVECTQPYERVYKCCPHCGHYPVPASRNAPEHVDGDLHEMSPEVLMALRGQVEAVNESPESVGNRMRFAGAPDVAWRSAVKNCKARNDMQGALRESIAWFAHHQQQLGRPTSESYRRFYHMFGTDVMTAQTLGRPEALVLADKINDYLGGGKCD